MQSRRDSTKLLDTGLCSEVPGAEGHVAAPTNDVTCILAAIEQGEPQTAEQLLPLVYDELKKLAAAKLARERPGQTLQATALVHEAYLRLVGGGDDLHWNDRRHFFMAAAEAMRRILQIPGKSAIRGQDGEGPQQFDRAALRLDGTRTLRSLGDNPRSRFWTS
jgi:hypothetical protein